MSLLPPKAPSDRATGGSDGDIPGGRHGVQPGVHTTRDDTEHPGTSRSRTGWNRTLGIACIPAVAGYVAGFVLLAVVTLVSAGAESTPGGAAQAAAVALLAAHQVPLTVVGAPLGTLPLLPTVLLGTLIARAAAGVAARTGISSPADAAWVAGAIAGAHGVLGTALALVATPTAVTAQPVQAALGCALVAGAAAGIGLARPCGLVPVALRRVPRWVPPGLVAGGAGLGVLLAAGLATVLLGLVLSASEVLDRYEVWGDGAGSAVGLTMISIGYLPNAAIAGMSWLAGSGVSVGEVSASAVAVHDGRLPAVPLLAALPHGPVQSWWVAALIVPVVVGVLVGRRCAAESPDPLQRLWALGVAAVALSAGGCVLALLAGGRLGAGAFDPVTVPAASLAIALLAATLLGGCAGALLSHRAPPAAPEGAGTPEASGVSGADAAEPGADAAEPDVDAAEPDADAAEPDADTAEPDADTAEPDADAAETETAAVVDPLIAETARPAEAGDGDGAEPGDGAEIGDTAGDRGGGEG